MNSVKLLLEIEVVKIHALIYWDFIKVTSVVLTRNIKRFSVNLEFRFC